MRLMLRLLDLILPPRPTEALLRSATLESAGAFLTPRVLEAAVAPVTALLPYREPLVRALIVEAKYRDSAHAQALLGAILREYLERWREDADALASGPFIVVPVPLGAKRRKARGYNQVERVCETALASPLRDMRLVPGLLERVRDTTPQTRLPKEARRRNLADAFCVRTPLESTATYIVVDDVVTTGATLSAAAAALASAGAKRVQLLALAH
ncbi:MAG TPA: phosphoribosyltransferase family protein [Candidatus Paceibacterota bacterium]|nr:phosphoribosyltransferase family protein [Candidatus Paceibacterota bacterium]